jgi:hypothetical protein
METGILQKAGIVAMLIVAGMAGAGRLAADPTSDKAGPATSDTSPPATSDTSPPVTADAAVPAIPARPQTADEKALQSHVDALQAQVAAAVSSGNAAGYETDLNKIAARNCRFYSVSGQSVELPKFLTGEKQVLATQGPGLTETSKTLSLTITGPTALQTGVLTDDQDVTDTAGTYGKKGKMHHWQRLTFFRAHWAEATSRHVSTKRASALNPDDWKAQEIAFTDIQIFLDGTPYIPPSARKNSTRKNTTRTTKPKTNNRRPRSSRRRNPEVITGGQGYTF